MHRRARARADGRVRAGGRRRRGRAALTGAVAARLADGRLHLQHGPIDLIVDVDAEPDAVERAYERAGSAFGPALETLVAELPALRRCVDPADPPTPRGPVARRMLRAVLPWATPRTFPRAHDPVTSMAAVAGAVADHVLAAILAPDIGPTGTGTGPGPLRAAVNDGGDIALRLAPGQRYRVGPCTDPRTGALAGVAEIRAGIGVGGVATSGRHGRSRSLGVADAVTVLAGSAAGADVAATLIANAVDLPGSTRIARVPASELDPDSDLGERLVTVDVAPLSDAERRAALDAAAPLARAAVARGLAIAVVASLQGEMRVLAGDSSAFPRRHASDSRGA